MNTIDSHIHFGSFSTNYFYGCASDAKTIEKIYKDYWGIVILPSEDWNNKNALNFVKSTKLNAKFGVWMTPDNFEQTKHLDFDLIKIHPSYTKIPITDAVYDGIINFAEASDSIVECHSGGAYETQYRHIINRAKDYPSVKFIIGHMGGKLYQDTWNCPIDAEPYHNVYIDTTMKIKHHWIKHCADVIGTKRMKFGSDYPFMHPAVGIEAIKSADVNEEDILFNTAKEMFW